MDEPHDAPSAGPNPFEAAGTEALQTLAADEDAIRALRSVRLPMVLTAGTVTLVGGGLALLGAFAMLGYVVGDTSVPDRRAGLVAAVLMISTVFPTVALVLTLGTSVIRLGRLRAGASAEELLSAVRSLRNGWWAVGAGLLSILTFAALFVVAAVVMAL